VLAILLERLRLAGVTHAVIALGYLGELVQTYFGEGGRTGLGISYLMEEEPLGTAGPVARLTPQAEPFLVVNGDILTNLPFDELYRAHVMAHAAATVAARTHQVQLDFGRLRTRGRLLTAWEEKPTWASLVGIGVYVLSPEAQALCPPRRIEMPGLIDLLLQAGQRVVVHQTNSYWRDIGQPEVYKAANQNPPDFVHQSTRDGVCDRRVDA